MSDFPTSKNTKVNIILSIDNIDFLVRLLGEIKETTPFPIIKNGVNLLIRKICKQTIAQTKALKAKLKKGHGESNE